MMMANSMAAVSAVSLPPITISYTPAVSLPPITTSYSVSLPPITTNYAASGVSLPLNAANYASPPPLQDDFNSITAYFDGPISLGEDWAILSIPPATPPTAAKYGGPPPPEEDWKVSIPLGMKFRPTDKELIVNYLQVEYLHHGCIQRGIITYTDIYEYEPDQLQALAVDHGDGKMYFFTRIKKIGRSKTDRSVKSKNGYWKATQAPKPIKGESGDTIGYKMSLTYIQNKVKTPWLMSEYRLEYSSNSKHSSEELVLAVVYHHRRKRSDDDDN